MEKDVLQEALLLLWATATVESHIPFEDNYGRSCDEQGCAICNIGNAEDFLSYLKHEHPDHLPDDNEIAEAIEELLARL